MQAIRLTQTLNIDVDVIKGGTLRISYLLLPARPRGRVIDRRILQHPQHLVGKFKRRLLAKPDLKPMMKPCRLTAVPLMGRTTTCERSDRG